MHKLNQYFIKNYKITLIWMWVFFAIAFLAMLIMNVFFPYVYIGYFFGIALPPSIIAVYLRIMYSLSREQRLADKQAVQASTTAKKSQHKRKKRR